MRALFVVRHHNDFDSMVPVVDGWVRRSAHNAAMVYFASPALRWRGDYRTSLLRNTTRVQFTDIWQIAGKGDGGRIARLWARNSADDHFFRKLLQIATEASILPGYSARMTRMLDDFDPHIVAFDWYSVPSRRKSLGLFGYQETLLWTRASRRPLISLPHGLMLYSQPDSECRISTPYNAILVESNRKKKILDCGVSEVIVAGSARYDPKWVRRIADILDRTVDPKFTKTGKTRIVFFSTKPKRFFNLQELLEWLRHLAEHRDVELVVQPHPRGQKNRAFSSIAAIKNVTIDSVTPASRLISQADIVSTLVSSVVAEAVVRKRELLFPKFLTKIETQFDVAGACVSLTSLRDTHAAIDAFRAGKRVPRENYEKFLDQSVYGSGGRDTMGRYSALMAQFAEAGRTGFSVSQEPFAPALEPVV